MSPGLESEQKKILGRTDGKRSSIDQIVDYSNEMYTWCHRTIVVWYHKFTGENNGRYWWLVIDFSLILASLVDIFLINIIEGTG